MDEKRTFGEFIKANKGKIIKGALIAIGVAAGIVIVVKTVQYKASLGNGGSEILDGLRDGLSEGTEVLGDAAANV